MPRNPIAEKSAFEVDKLIIDRYTDTIYTLIHEVKQIGILENRRIYKNVINNNYKFNK